MKIERKMKPKQLQHKTMLVTLPRIMFLLLAGGVGVRGEIRESDSKEERSTLSLWRVL